MVALRVLGPLDAEVDAAVVELGGRRQRAVLLRLVAAGGHEVSSDRMVHDLWGESASPKVISSLQAYVSRLRGLLLEHGEGAGTPVIASTPAGYRLALPPDAVDAWRFERAVTSAERMPRHRPADVLGALDAALSLWRGEPYAGFGGEEWAAAEVRRLAELRTAGREAKGEALNALGRHGQAVRVLEDLVADEPLRESAWAALAVALYTDSRQADALGAIRRAAEALAMDAGLGLGEELTALQGQILAHDLTSARWSVARDDAVAQAPAAGSFVGRIAELHALTAASEAARRGAGTMCVIDGPAGTGKSRLAEETLRRLVSDGWIGATGRCIAGAGALAGSGWMEIMASLESHVGAPDPRAPASPGEDADPLVQRHLRHGLISGYVLGAAAAAPLVIVLDDVQFADDESLLILSRVVHDLPGVGVLLLCVRRTDGAQPENPVLDAITARPRTRVHVGGLSADESALLVQALAGRPIGAADAEAIHERTGGNPFFLQQIATLLVSDDVASAIAGLPAAIRDVVRRRLAPLPRQTRELLALVSVAGRDVDAATLTEALGLSEDAAIAAVESGIDSGLLREPAPRRIAFAHDLVRESVVAGLSQLRRASLHARIASAIATVHPGDHSAIAHHLALSERADLAAETARQAELAAESEEARFAFSAAASHWRHVVNALRVGGASRSDALLDASLRLLRATALSGAAADAREFRAEVLSSWSHADPDIVGRIVVAYDVSSLWLNQEYGRVDHELVHLIETCLRYTPEENAERRCRLLCCLSLELEWSGSPRGRDAAERAPALARILGRDDILCTALGCVFRHSYLPGELAARERLAAECLRVALDSGSIPPLTLAYQMAAECACARGAFEVADRCHGHLRRLADTYHLTSSRAMSLWYDGLRQLCAGRLDDARAAYRAAAEASTTARVWEQDEAWVYGSDVCLAIHENRMAEMVERSVKAAEVWPGPGREALALALEAAGDHEAALSVASVELRFDAGYLLAATWRALAGLRLDDHARIRWSSSALLPYSDEFAGADSSVVGHGPVANILGDLAARSGDVESARTHYRTAIHVARRAGSDFWESTARGSLDRLG